MWFFARSHSFEASYFSLFFICCLRSFSSLHEVPFSMMTPFNAIRVPGIDSNDGSVIDVLLQRFLGFLSLLTITSHLDSRHFLSLCCGTLQTWGYSSFINIFSPFFWPWLFLMFCILTTRASTSKQFWSTCVLVRVRSDSLADMRLRIWNKTMAVRIFRSAKIANFGGLFFQIVHLFRLGSNGFL